MATKKKTDAATDVVVSETTLRNSLRNQAERSIIEAHRADFDAKLEELYTAAGLTFRKRLTKEQREAAKVEAKKAKDRAKLDALLAANPDFVAHIVGQTSIEDLQNTGGVGE